MWHDTCVQGYQKCDMRHVYSVIRNVTHVYRVIRSVTWDMFTGLSEMRHETCVQDYHKCDMTHAQAYQKCDMKHVHMVLRNVT